MGIGSLGVLEIIGIILVILLLFGARKIPEVMRALGEGIKEFRKVTSEASNEIKRAVDEAPLDPPDAPKN